MRPYLLVPETKPLTQMLEEFREGKSHMAMVVDEFGTIVGLVTVEDVLEQIVGPIADEYDEKTGAARAGSSGAGARRRHAHSRPGDRLRNRDPRGGRLRDVGRLPAVQARAHSPGRAKPWSTSGRRYTVLEMDRNRIARVRIEKTAAPEAPAQTPGKAIGVG